jgi:hypothetical protein
MQFQSRTNDQGLDMLSTYDQDALLLGCLPSLDR